MMEHKYLNKDGLKHVFDIVWARMTSLEKDITQVLNGIANRMVQEAPSDGTLYGRKDGAWSEMSSALVFKNITVATKLTGLPIDNYSIKVTLSAASALSFASTPYEGWECMIDIKNTKSSAITQALPNATGWQCDETSMTIESGKIASISVRYVHGTYVVLAKGN